MNYRKNYDTLILKAKNRINGNGYFERHHILPKSLGGIDTDSNLVYLTAREHYLAHWLLFKIAKTPNDRKKMGLAFGMMRRQKAGQARICNTKMTSRKFESARMAASHAMAIRMTGATLENSEMRRKQAKAISETLSNKTKFRWFHPKYGTHECTAQEIVKTFKDEHLIGGNLLKVASGEFNISHGWVLEKNKNNYETILRSKKINCGEGGKIGGKMRHVTNGIQNTRISKSDLENFLSNNPDWKLGSSVPPRQKGYKILISSDNKIRKIAYPGSEEFDRLIELGFLQKSKK